MPFGIISFHSPTDIWETKIKCDAQNNPSTFQRTFLEKNLVYAFKKFSSPSNGQFLNELAGTVKNIFLLYNGQSIAVCPENFEKRKPPTN